MILIADSGSTKTDWVLASDTNIKYYTTIGFNPYLQSKQDIANELKQNLVPLIKTDEFNQIKKIFFYGAGCSSEEKQAIVKEAIRENFNNLEIEVNHDLLAAARALCKQKAGIAAILGTGSNSCYYDGEKIIANVPSLGYYLGDEGSGSHIGANFIKAYLYKELPPEIEEKFYSEFGFTKEMLLENIYKKPFPNRFLAGFNIFIYTNINNPFLQKIIENSFQQFFDKHICKYKNHQTVNLNFVGSIAFVYKNILQKVATKNNFKIGTIIKSPLQELINYHLKQPINA